ncbi:MAG: L-histidine N(alpha)-methyltransferase [Gammaproteobacteria bacterium]|nr:L-histidine N(alpha)-methyltransferase [Gammaproteobacteria bacterium]
MTDPAELQLTEIEPKDATMAKEVLAGLRASPKVLSPKYFYDERGSQLFDEITALPEYYPTRTEIGIMEANIDEIVALVGRQASLIEFGSGSSLKTRILLDNLNDLAAYVPVEISREYLLAIVEGLQADYPHIEMLPVFADFTKPFELPAPRVAPVKNVVYFPGSTIGNFAPAKALDLLRVMASEAKQGGALLIGVDLKKDTAILEAAYNDSQGVTARFNLNMLRRLNNELDADFVLDDFRHRAIYNEEEGRIEMHLISERDQSFVVAGEQFSIKKGESIRTECSYKFTLEEFSALAAQAGFQQRQVWKDSNALFSVQFLECVSNN